MKKSSIRPDSLSAPRAYLEAARALALLGRRGRMHYAVLNQRRMALLGPFRLGQELEPDELLQMLAAAEGAELTNDGAVPVLQATRTDATTRALADINSGDPRRRRRAAFALAESRRLEAISPLVQRLGDQDHLVRRTAALALASIEGDFEHEQWAGRLSVFELHGPQLDVDLLLWLIEEAAEPGGLEWKAAASILGRARVGELPRCIWWHAWNRMPGTVIPTVWAIGRCGDPDMGHMLDMLLRNPGTNAEADRFTVAAALGQLGQANRLAKYAFATYAATSAELRCAAAYGLGFCRGAPESHELLGRVLADSDPRVREVAVHALGHLDSAPAVARLTTLLGDEGAERSLRAAAAQALARSSGDAAQAPLLAAVQSVEPAVRAAVADALAILGGPAAAAALEALLDDHSRRVIAAAARALAALGAPEHLSRLGTLLSRSATDPEIRAAAAIGLGQGRRPEAVRPLSRVALDPAANWRLRCYAVRSLAMLADRAGQKTIRRLIESAPPVRLTLLPLRYLDLGDPDETVRYLEWWGTHGDVRHEQSTAAERIGELGTAEGTRFLAGGYDVFDNYTRWAHIWPLIQNDSPGVRRKLVELLQGRRRSVRANAALALAGRRDPAVVDALIEACRDPVESVRMAAASSLGECGDPAAAPVLTEMMEKDENLAAAHQALRALRLREFATLPEVEAAFDRVRGTARDCGVPGGPTLLDQPANSFVLRRWPLDYDDPLVPNLTYESSLTADSLHGRVVQWGSHGRRYDTPQTGFTWVFDAKANRWRRPSPRQEPPGTCCNRGLTFDPIRGLAISPKSPSGFGGHGWLVWLRMFTSHSIPWVFDVIDEQWYPMRPFTNPGSCSQVASCFDWRHDVALFLKNGPQVYDPHANEWVSMKPAGPGPDPAGGPPGAYDPVTGRFIVVAGADERGRARTWAYDLAENKWTDLNPANPPPPLENTPMVYDSANDVMLAFHSEPGRVAVYAYHPRDNRWEPLPPTHPAPSYNLSDAAYDAANGVVVLIGGHDRGASGSVTIRETWTYRYQPCAKPAPSLRLNLDITAGMAVSLAWNTPPGDAVGCHVYRGTGPHPWAVDFARITEAPLGGTAFTDPAPPAPAVTFYQVRAVGADGQELLVSNPVRTQPLPVREVFTARASDGAIRLAWKPSPGPAVAGYNVYRAPLQAFDPWREHFDPAAKVGELVKLNADLVKDTAFSDPPTAEVKRCSETDWAPLHAYVIRAVNLLGVESGPSPVTLSIAGPPGPVLVVAQEDGSLLVISAPSGSHPVSGYHLYRLDCYHGDMIFRSRGAPQPGNVFIDDETWPVGDRRSYYVIPVDEVGQLGVPSSPAWAYAMP